jgi:O-antigen/teichoic acid export membrane protein
MIYAALKRLGKHSVIYALGPAVHKLLGFLLLPFVTVWIGTSASTRAGNYGVLEIGSVTIAIAAQVLGINLLHGMTRFHPEYATEKERGTLVTTTLILLAGTTGAALLLAWIFRGPAAQLVFESRDFAPAIVVVFAILFFQTIGQVGLRWLQILERSVTYGVLTTIKLLAEIGLKVWLLLIGLAYMGAFYSVLGCEALIALVLFTVIVRKLGLSFSGAMAKRLVAYSWPLVLSGLFMFVLHQADRFFVQHLRGEGQVGLYGLAYKLGSVGNTVFFEAFGLIWFPFVFALKDEEVVRRLSRKVLTYFNLLMCAVTLVLALFAREIIRAMAAPEFHEAWRALPIIALGYLFWALFQVSSTTFYLQKKTGTVSALVASAAAMNLACNAILVPRFGYLGAAWATVLTFAALAVATWIAAERLMPIRPETGRVIVPILLAGALFWASTLLPDLPAAGTIAAKCALAALLPAILVVSGYLAPEERAKIREIWGTIRPR